MLVANRWSHPPGKRQKLSSDEGRAGAAQEGGGRARSSTSATLTPGSDPDVAVEDLADTGPGRAVLATIADHDKPAALDAARATLADPTDRPGVPLNAGTGTFAMGCIRGPFRLLRHSDDSEHSARRVPACGADLRA
jgi:hypothetical protein